MAPAEDGIELDRLRRRVAELEAENRGLVASAEAGRDSSQDGVRNGQVVARRKPDLSQRRTESPDTQDDPRQARIDAVLAAADYEGAIAAGQVDLALAQALNQDLVTSRAALRESEQQLRLILESAVEYAIFTMDLEGRITTWNEGARRIFGYDPSEILGQFGHIIFTGGDIEKGCPEVEMSGALAEGKANDERWHVRKDGSRFWAHGLLMPIQDDGVVRGFLKILRDRTEERRAEEALAESEQRFRVLADAIPQLAWMANPDGRITWYNRRWFEFTGATPEEVEGWGWRTVHHPDHVERVVEHFRRSMETGEPWEDTFPLRGRDGQYRWFLSRALPVRDSDGRIVLWFGTNTDITEQRETAAALAKAVERQEMLTHEVSHRVKNSLQLVASLLRLQASGSRQAEVKSAINDAVARVSTIARVHDRLWRQSEVETLDFAGVLRDLCEDLQNIAPKCQLVCEAPPVVMPTDMAVPLGLVVNELVTNAFKHGCPEGCGEVRIVIDAMEAGSLRLSVADRGPGLPDGFDPRNHAGSLGMRLVSGMVRQLNGALDVVSAEPGARFVITLPLK